MTPKFLPRPVTAVFLALSLIGVMLGAAGAVSPPGDPRVAVQAHQATKKHGPKPTVVLVHGAFADSSGWSDVAGRLMKAGYPVIAFSNPLGPGQRRGVPAQHELFAQDLPRKTAQFMAATQRPGALAALVTPSGPPAWTEVPSWYVVARQDRIIPPEAERVMAERAGSTVVEIDSSHVVMMSHPGEVSQLIQEAAR